MATNAAAVAIAMMNGGGGGSGGDVTRQYVDDHLALKVDKVEGKGLSTNDYTNADKSTVSNSPIADTTTGINPTITNSADGYVQSITIYGRTDTVEGELRGIGEDGELNVETCGKNLFDKTAVTANSYLDVNNGTTLPYSGWCVSDYTKVTSNSYTYSINAAGVTTNAIAFCFYDASKNYISTTQITYQGEPITVNVPNNAIYIRYEAKNDYVDIVQFELGSTATAYEPYKSTTTATVTTGIPLYSVGDVKDELNEKKGVVVKRCEKTTEQGEEVIVPLATPVELPLTASELAQLRNLRTYNPTTNITITDEPTVDVGYLLDTDNGKAIGHLITTFSEMVLFETDLDTGAQITLNATITLSQPFTNFDEIVIEWGFKSNNYYEVFSNSFRSEYLSQMKRYRENHSSTQVEINLNYFNGGIYTCFIPTADDKLYITAIAGGASRYITKIIGRKYSAA